MKRSLFIDDITELCTLLNPFLKERGIELAYCNESGKLILTMPLSNHKWYDFMVPSGKQRSLSAVRHAKSATQKSGY